jgi:choice-of-anchor A domain-containing protein
MRLLIGFLFPAVVLSTLLIPATGKTDEAHSWCVPGAAKSPNGSSDRNTNLVVTQVCSQIGFESCCKDRWSLWCVQEGADWARTQSAIGDVCGRYTWSQGQIGSSGQLYPQDFSLITLAGGASGFRDMWGPVAANGDVTPATGFSLNGGSNKQPLAILATGNVTLTSGTVYGSVEYGKSYTPKLVTYANGGSASKLPNPSPINFGTLSTNLATMSSALNAYPPTASASRPTGSPTVTFTGTDPEMNVFSLTTDQIKGATSFSFNVPAGSAAIINVSGKNTTVGTNAYFVYAGFNGTPSVPPNSKILWNFPDAKVLQISGMYFPGSILAPVAQATLLNGAINGTVVVHDTLNAATEFHWFPYQGFTCSRGCLCWDTTWSCSRDTYIDDSGSVVFPAPEAGFFDLTGGSYWSLDKSHTSVNRTSPEHRIWYSFQPASSTPATKPLAVLFNGGPGAATSAFLFSFNTGPFTLDPTWAGSQPIVANPNSWTQFANLLYIDAPGTGFSYPMGLAANNYPNVGIDLDRDAASVLDVVVRFLHRHPLIQKNPIVLVGESYGGTRAVLMLEHLFNYQDLNQTNSLDQALYNDLVTHFTAVFGLSNPTPDQIATQFSHQVLIEPAVAGQHQVDAGHALSFPLPGCQQEATCNPNLVSPSCDLDLCSQPTGTYLAYVQSGAKQLTTIAVLQQALGIDPTTIYWLTPSTRTLAYGRAGLDIYSTIIPAQQITSLLGPLDPNDNYLLMDNGAVLNNFQGYDANARWWTDNTIGTSFLNNVRYVKTFITNAGLDISIPAAGIPPALNNNDYANLVSNAIWETNAPSGATRMGVIEVTYQAGMASPATRDIRFPPYTSAGHSVSIYQPADLLADVMAWYSSTLQPYPVQPELPASLRSLSSAVLLSPDHPHPNVRQ